jgi:hypothetical protein
MVANGKNIKELQSGSEWGGGTITYTFLGHVPSYYDRTDYEADSSRGI